MATVKTTVAAEVKVTGLDKAGQSVGNFRKELKEATNDLVNMSGKFGIASTEAQAAAKRVAELRDRIGDAKQLADTFNPDKKFVALGGALQGVTAGFSAFTGALGLFGEQGKEIEQVLLKVQSAMALQQGLSGLKSAIDSFKLLGQAIKASTVFQRLNNAATVAATVIQRAFGASVVGTGAAFNVLKAAIIATGIGALVVVLATVISKMDLFTSKTKSAAEAQDELTAATENFNKASSELIGFYDRVNELELKRARIAGASEKEILDIQVSALQKRIDLRNKDINEAIKHGLAISELTKENQKDTDAIQDLQLDYQLKIANDTRIAAEKASSETAARNKKEAEDLKKLIDELGKLRIAGREKEKQAIEEYGKELANIENEQAAAERQRLIDNKALELETKLALAEQALIDDPDSIENKIAKINADFAIEMSNFEGNEIQRQNAVLLHEQALTKIKEDSVEARRQLQMLEVQQVQTGLSTIAGALDSFAEVAGRQSAAGKALSIAVTVIKTIQGGVSAFMGMVQQIPGPVGIALGAVAAAGVVASGYASIAKMKAVPIPGKGGGSGGATPTAPTAPIIPRPQTTTLDQQSINQVGNAASRAYVLETDVSGNQERIRRLNRAARIN